MRCAGSSAIAAMLAVLLPASVGAAALPGFLSETGLYAPGTARLVASDVMSYSPQYPLWTDGAVKRRWIWLPAAATIDASDPDHWVFPVGTKLWKEFAFAGPIETRFMEKQADGTWSFATYHWDAAGEVARLAPERGVEAVDVGHGQVHDIPGRWDCRSCHGNRPEGVLGFGALQLSSDRDPLAPHAEPLRPGDVDLDALLARGVIVGLPDAARRPRIDADSARERAVLGYLHGNCGGCHQSTGALSAFPLRLDHSIAKNTDDAPDSTFFAAGVVVAGDPVASPLHQRLASRDPYLRMPPLGSREVDSAALALVDAWIREDLPHRVAIDSLQREQPGQSPNLEERSR